MTSPAEESHEEVHRAYFSEVLESIRRLMGRQYGLKEVSIRPIGTGGSRLSIPVRITGTGRDGRKERFFGKILGSSDLTVAASIQFFKNIYLHMNAQDPIFEASRSAEDMARDQFESLKAIHDLGIPTARPFGYHRLDSGLWLVVAEFLEARPMAETGDVTAEQLSTVFRYLKKMHRNKVFHGDLKPENIMVGEKIYVLDVGRFRPGVNQAKKRAYDLVCLICSLLESAPAEKVVAVARKFSSRKDLRAGAAYLDLVQRRPDINFTDETKEKLRRLMVGRRLLSGSSVLVHLLGLLPATPPDLQK
jgi:tRNA A-37 threonylcarbamoyl transferase component Bud32